MVAPLIVALTLTSGGCALLGDGIDIELTEQQLQGIVDRVFPLDNDDADARVDVMLSHPVVTITDGSAQIRLALDITASVELIDEEQRPAAARAGRALRNAVTDRERTPLEGTVAVASGIRYDNATGQIFLDDVDIEQLDIDRLPERNRDAVLRLTSAAITRALRQTPIYTLEDAGTLGNLADTLLRDVTVADGVLRITIGIG
jgi:hypothetical protein